MEQTVFPKLLFEYEFGERERFEAKARGYLSHVVVEHSDGSRYSVVFYDCVRLQQDLEDEVSAGRMCVADPGMIVVSEVTPENIRTAVDRLAAEGFFGKLRPLD
jgi:hypothetical protein